MTWLPATAIAGSAVVTLASCRIQIVRGDREPPPRLRDDGARRRLAAERHNSVTNGRILDVFGMEHL
jgi:hypothetical protein